MSQTRILVVEDEAIIALSIQRKLEKMGLEVPLIASSGEEAIRQAANIQPDLVLMEISLDGPAIEAATQIWQRFNIPVVYLTANSEQEPWQGAKIGEPFGYLLNSCSEQELRTAIDFALYKQQMEKKLRESEQRLATTLNSISEAVAALRQSELKYRSLVQSAKDAIILADVTGNIIGWNAGAEAIFGYQEEELLGQPLQLIMPARYRAAHEQGMNRIQATCVPNLIGQTVEIHALRKDGTEFPVELALTTWSSEAGTFYSGIIRDITERKQAEKERRRFTNQLRTAADLAQQINGILDLDQLLAQTVSELHKRFSIDHVHIYLLDESRQELVMHTGSGEVPPRQRDVAIPFSRRQNLLARAARKQELVLINEVGDEPGTMPARLQPDTRAEVAVPLIVGGRVLGVLHLQDKQPQRFTPSTLDVLRTLAGQVATAIQNAHLFEQVQQNLAESQRTAERLRELDQLKSEFLASMSHELRTPLNSIIGYAEIILMGLNGPLTEEMTEDMEAIRHSGQHLLHIINEILDLAKIEAGHMALGYEQVELSGLLDQVRVRHLALLHDKPVELFIEMDANVPPIEADRVRLNQILTNLVTNAIKFTEQGKIFLHATYDDEWIQIMVQDEGIGIKKSDLASIFEQFRQVDGSDTRRAGGTGLGLTITNHLVQLHGGTITVESEFGKGSTFFVRLPVKRPPEEVNSEQPDFAG